MNRLLLCLILLLSASTAFAELMTFEKETEEIVANDQSREQVEAFALQKVKRLAVEEAGTYISSLTVVNNMRFDREEIIALASGVVQAKIIGLPEVWMVDKVIHVKVKARVQVDTAILDKQVAELLKEKGTIKKLEEEQKKVKELEIRLANLQSTELKRLEELNSQAIAMEQERERRRMANEEMTLKAQGELNKAEIERLEKQREIQQQTARILAEQEQQRKAEAASLLNEQDRIRRAQLENEQRWNDLARKSKLAQQQWAAIDDSLSLKQALAETKSIKQEIATLKQRSEFQYEESIRTLKAAYQQQKSASSAKMPPPLAARDPFESTAEYNARKAAYDNQVKAAKNDNAEKIEKLNGEEGLKLAQAKLEYLENQIKVLRPFVERLKALQARTFLLPGEPVTVDLGTPDADRNCFPTTITHKTDRWTVDWSYTDRNKARDIYSTRTFLKAEAIAQLDDTTRLGYVMTEARITHPGNGTQQRLVLAKPREFAEVSAFDSASNGTLAALQKEIKKAAKVAVYGKEFSEKTTGMEFVRVDYYDELLYVGKYEVTQGQWQMIMGNNPSSFKNCGANCPVENVSWNDTQQFIQRLNSQSGEQYRLLTKLEWVYACTSGGRNETYCGGNNVDDVAWYESNSGNRTHPVGTKQPNGFDLYDMSGNVWEWCQDADGSSRVFRGGSWEDIASKAKTSYRDSRYPHISFRSLGFRLVLPVVQ